MYFFDTIPVEVIMLIYAFLHGTPNRVLLGVTCKRMYALYTDYNERYKHRILHTSTSLCVAALRGDPILKKVKIDRSRVNANLVAMCCVSGNIKLAKAFLRKGITRTNFDTFCHNFFTMIYRDRYVKRSCIGSMHDYVLYISMLFRRNVEEDIERFFRDLAGPIHVYGDGMEIKEDLVEFMGTLDTADLSTIQTRIAKEYFYNGDYENGVIWRTESNVMHNDKIYAYSAIRCPIENVETYTKNIEVAIELFERYYLDYVESNVNKSTMQKLLLLATKRSHHASNVVSKWISSSSIFVEKKHLIDYDVIWINSRCKDKHYVELWNIDVKRCIILLFEGIKKCKMHLHSQSRKRAILRNLMRCFEENVFELLDSEEKEKYKCFGFFCPKCSKTSIEYQTSYDGMWRKHYKCEYCLEEWSCSLLS